MKKFKDFDAYLYLYKLSYKRRITQKMKKFREFDTYENPTLISANIDLSWLCNCDYEKDLAIKCDAIYKDYDGKRDVTEVTLTMSLYSINQDEGLVDERLVSEITIQQHIYWKKKSHDFDINPDDIRTYLWHAIEMGRLVITQSCFLGNLSPIILNITEDDITVTEYTDKKECYE